jgi:Sec-independent protein secretion pathway component TatC
MKTRTLAAFIAILYTFPYILSVVIVHLFRAIIRRDRNYILAICNAVPRLCRAIYKNFNIYIKG